MGERGAQKRFFVLDSQSHIIYLFSLWHGSFYRRRRCRDGVIAGRGAAAPISDHCWNFCSFFNSTCD